MEPQGKMILRYASPERGCALQPRVARNEPPWVTRGTNALNSNGVATKSACLPSDRSKRCGGSIPQIFFIPNDFMFSQEPPQFFLKTNLPMMFFLPGDV
jgi:hypothetical protein